MIRWKALSLALLLSLAVFSAGCSPPAPEPEPESQPESSAAVSETSSQEETVSSQREYVPTKVKYYGKEFWDSSQDVEEIFALCSEAVLALQNAADTKTEMDFSRYIENPALIDYMEQQLKATPFPHGTNVIHEIYLCEYNTRVHNNYLDPDRELVYVAISCGAEFLVESTDDRIVIAEWYFYDKDSMDSFCRGKRDIKNEPLYWDNYDPEELKKAIEEMPNKFPYGPPDPVK